MAIVARGELFVGVDEFGRASGEQGRQHNRHEHEGDSYKLERRQAFAKENNRNGAGGRGFEHQNQSTNAGGDVLQRQIKQGLAAEGGTDGQRQQNQPGHVIAYLEESGGIGDAGEGCTQQNHQ